MTKRRTIFLTAGLVLAIGLSGYASAQMGAPAESSGASSGESVRSETVLTIHGKIAAIDQAQKQITLEANGKRVTFKVENPYNLKASKVGDPVVVHYYEIVSIRKKKPGEEVPSVSVGGGISTAQSGTPGAVAAERASVLLTVVDVDTEHGTVTLKGPDGSVEKVKARDPKNLKLIKAGDELVVTVTRATAIAVEKEPAS
jgi:hypothetical protein